MLANQTGLTALSLVRAWGQVVKLLLHIWYCEKILSRMSTIYVGITPNSVEKSSLQWLPCPSAAQHKHAVISLRINLHRQITDPRAGRLYLSVLSVAQVYIQTNMDFYYILIQTNYLNRTPFLVLNAHTKKDSDLMSCSQTHRKIILILNSEWVPSEWESKQLIKA